MKLSQKILNAKIAANDPFHRGGFKGLQVLNEKAKGSGDLSCPLVNLFDEIEWEMLMEDTYQFI